MKPTLKAIGWLVGLSAGALLLFFVYPDLSENSKWVIAVLIVGGFALHGHSNWQQEQEDFRYRVLNDLRDIKQRLGIDS